MQSDAQLLNRISVESETMAGKPVIKGTRLTVEIHFEPACPRGFV